MRAPSTSAPTLLKKRNNAALNNVPNLKVNFNLVHNLKALLINFDKNIEKETLEYNNLICDIRDAGIEIKVSTLLSCINFNSLFFKRLVGNYCHNIKITNLKKKS